MPSAALALIAAITFFQWAPAAAGPQKNLKIGDQCKDSSCCASCLSCEDVSMGTGRGEKECKADASQLGFTCDNNGAEGECNGSGECVFLPGTYQDPHMQGLLGQRVDWMGEDGAWYALVSDSADMQISVRLTAPLPEEFPERQLMTGVAVKYEGGHSIIIENKQPYNIDTEGCPENAHSSCLSENSLQITIDDQEGLSEPVDNLPLGGQATITAVNLPAECQPFGGDRIWAETYAQMIARRRLAATGPMTFTDWASTWAPTTAAPSWCRKYLDETGAEGALEYNGKHTVFRIVTPSFTMRLHHGTNHQSAQVLESGRALPELDFWQMDLHLESYNFNAARVTGLLGETIRPMMDANGVPIMSGKGALRGEVEDYRISGPLATDFAFFHE